MGSIETRRNRARPLTAAALSAAAQEDVSSSGAQRPMLTPAQAAALDEWTYSLALQTANWGSPLVTMYLLRYHDAVGPQANIAARSGTQKVAGPDLATAHQPPLPL